jgi:hypothetical protein
MARCAARTKKGRCKKSGASPPGPDFSHRHPIHALSRPRTPKPAVFQSDLGIPLIQFSIPDCLICHQPSPLAFRFPPNRLPLRPVPSRPVCDVLVIANACFSILSPSRILRNIEDADGASRQIATRTFRMNRQPGLFGDEKARCASIGGSVLYASGPPWRLASGSDQPPWKSERPWRSVPRGG